jgi:murein L,D-transpeptidase YcbB/YkuD
MRVKEPFEFMRELFRDGGANYSESQLQSIFDSNKPTTIKLSRHIPVHVLYQTVKERGGKIHFLYDVYMYDQIVWESMAGHRKSSFRVPQKRLTKIERIGSRIR